MARRTGGKALASEDIFFAKPTRGDARELDSSEQAWLAEKVFDCYEEKKDGCAGCGGVLG
jgi:hypothetical protein